MSRLIYQKTTTVITIFKPASISMSGWRGKRRDREDPWFLFNHTWSSSWCWRIPLPKVCSLQQRAFRSSWSLSQGWHPKCYVHIADAKVHSVQQTGGTSISLCIVGAALTRTSPGCWCGELWPENLPDHIVPLAGIYRQGRLDRRWHPHLGPGWSSTTDISHV